ncbi:MAG: hypothetical protein ISP41_03960 [Alphaproteobacteria bacterium]|jgi:hypothetical protein|nr:hypothetical protein [Alphaproteobacteria bacterium]
MVQIRLPIAVLSTVLMLGGCSFSTDALWPSLSGDAPSSAAPTVASASTVVPIKPSSGEASGQPLVNPGTGQAPPRLGSTNFQVEPPRAGQSTGTFVGNKVAQLRDDLTRLQASINKENADLQAVRQQTIANAQGYHSQVAGIRSRLQLGTTPGNPQLVSAWNQSQIELEKINTDIGRMNALSNRVAADAAMSSYLLEATRAAFGLSGAIDEDHRQLEVLEDDVNRTVVLIDRLLTELSDDIRRQSNYVSTERNDLNTLALAIKNGEFFGPSLASTAYTHANSRPTVGGISRPSARSDSRRPLVVIRFDRPDVNYQQALYTAVNRALQRQPDASFDLVSVSTLSGGTAQSSLNANSARRNAQSVLRALVDMGLPPSRVSLSATTVASGGNEVRLYIR